MRLPDEDLAHVLEHMAGWEELGGKRVFLTGASGFVGTWLTESFAWANERLGLDAELVPVARNLLPTGDFDFGIHAAKTDSFQADMEGARQILEFSAQRGVSRFLFTSSGAVYGKLPAGMTRVAEDFAGVPESDYAKAKQAGELLCAQSEVGAVIARMFTFSGPRLPLDANFAVGNFVRDVMAGGPVVVEGDGTSKRSYLYAADLAMWLWTLLLKGAAGRAYNVGSPDAVSIHELARTVVENTVPGTRIVLQGKGAADSYVPCIERAIGELGLRPRITLADGIRRMYAWNVHAKAGENGIAPATTP